MLRRSPWLPDSRISHAALALGQTEESFVRDRSRFHAAMHPSQRDCLSPELGWDRSPGATVTLAPPLEALLHSGQLLVLRIGVGLGHPGLARREATGWLRWIHARLPQAHRVRSAGLGETNVAGCRPRYAPWSRNTEQTDSPINRPWRPRSRWRNRRPPDGGDQDAVESAITMARNTHSVGARAR